MSFDIGRLRRSDQITSGGAVAFFVFLFFFDWYGGSYKGTVPAGGGSFGASIGSTGWDTFTNSRWIWLLTIIVAIGAVLLVAGQRKLELPVQPSVLVAGLGALSTLLILYRIIHHPSGGASFGGASFSYGIKIGIMAGPDCRGRRHLRWVSDDERRGDLDVGHRPPPESHDGGCHPTDPVVEPGGLDDALDTIHACSLHAANFRRRSVVRTRLGAAGAAARATPPAPFAKLSRRVRLLVRSVDSPLLRSAIHGAP